MLWGAMNNAVLGMTATSWEMNTISQNISNVNTTGFKRKETLFKTVMSESKASTQVYGGKLNVFGVKVADRTHIAAQGVITASTHTTDLAINGEGFFMVGAPEATVTGTTYSTGPRTAYSTDNPSEVMYTRAGNFYTTAGPNGEAYFMANGGNYLLGWMPEDDGTIDTSGDLVPVYSFPDTEMEGRATTTATVRGNLPAFAELSPSQFTTTQNVTDPNTGEDEELTLSWERVDGTTWTITPSLAAATGTATGSITVTCDVNGVIYEPAIGADGVALTWTSGAATSSHNLLGTTNTHTSTTTFGDPSGTRQTATLNWTRVSGNLWDVQATVPAAVGTIAEDTVRVAFDGQGRMISPSTGSLPFVIDWDAAYDTADATKINSEISLYAGNDLPTNLLKRPDIHVEKLSSQAWDSNFQSHDVTLAFERTGPNEWYMHTYSTDSTYPDAPVAPKQVTFTSAGVLNAAGDNTYTSDWTWADTVTEGTGTEKTVTSMEGTASVEFDFSQLTQYDATQTLGSIDQNGYGKGSLISAYFNNNGEYIGQYTNGETNKLFKVGIAQFTAENSLENISGTLFRRTLEAGDISVTGVEDAGGAVSLATSSLEGSNVDIGEEFTRMIVTQKAYSTNATVFKTADEMTTVARDLKA
ncbi:MAG: flagellar hook-basal body complex protein [Magnetospirillum sp.]|nr:flagellar hook-basal body complex protein [Magnetospirillum sp.]